MGRELHVLTPEQLADRQSVWTRIARECPEFTRLHDITDNYHTVREIVLGGSLPWEGANKRRPILPGYRVMDIGANAGIFTAYAAVKGAVVTAYEPHPIVGPIMMDMLMATGLYMTVELCPKAIWTYTGELPFAAYVNKDPMCTWYNGGVPNQGVSYLEFRNSRRVPCISFDEAIGDKEWDFVKMDIECAEFEVLLEAQPVTFDKIKFMYIEFHPWASDELYRRTIEKLSDCADFEGYFENEMKRWEVGYVRRK